MDDATDGVEISDRFASVLSVELVALTRKMLDETTDTGKRWECLREVLGELSQLRRDDHRGVRTTIKRFRWEREVEQDDSASLKRYYEGLRKQACAPIFARMQLESMAGMFGGGETGKKVAAFILEVQHELPPGTLGSGTFEPSESSPVHSNPAESNLIQPNPT